MFRLTALKHPLRAPAVRRWISDFAQPAGARDYAKEASNADATATVIADKIEFQKSSKSKTKPLTWWEILEKQAQRKKEGKTFDSLTLDDVKSDVILEKTRDDSFCFFKLPFKDDLELRDFYINASGKLRFGHLFQDLDSLAGKVAYTHCLPAEPMNVTASIDRIYVKKKIEEINKYNFIFVGYMTYTGTSSMEICIKGYAYEDELPEEVTSKIIQTDKSQAFLSANFTFVARNPATRKSHSINKLLPTSESEWVDFKRAVSHIAAKKLRAKTSNLEKVPPTANESSIIHSLYGATKNLANMDEKPRNVSLMKDTKLSAAQIQQPQYRNKNGIIFGGYLLRQTFELAYCSAGAFSNSFPRFVSLDNTTFKAPVPVGSVLQMDSEVCYTEHIHEFDEYSESAQVVKTFIPDFDPSANKISEDKGDILSVPGTLIQVKVSTKVRNLNESDKYTPTGTFVYSFYVPRDSEGFDSPGYSSVVPQSYQEMIDYVEGKRRAIDTAAYANLLKY